MNSSEYEKLLTSLKRRTSYPHQPDNVQHIQTHISHVFIVPPLVYKLKKPVDFGFLDYSTLKKRRRFCHREIELNRRLCNDIYLGVVGISKKDGNYYFEPDKSDGEEKSVIAYAVKMRKFADEYFLHHFIEDDTLTHQHLDRVADKLSKFYTAQKEKDLSKWGQIESIKVNTDENFDQTEKFIGNTIDQNAYDAIKYFTNKYYQRHEDLFQRRIKEGRIVDGHGDLHLEHIHIMPEEVRIYDCIEFNERFRYGDLAADLAYLAMDLDFNNYRQMERYFVNKMSEWLKDEDLLQIIDFYKCYRAYVKGKVKSLQSTEEEVPKKERDEAAELASRYFGLSLQYALLSSEPIVLVLMGRVGAGKSTFARHLEQKLYIEHFSTDRIRKNVAGLPLNARTPASKRGELYSAKMSDKTYQILLKKAMDCLKEGKSVILDATFKRASSRKRLIDKLGQDSRFLFVEMQASDEIIKQRLELRESQMEIISDARLEDFEKLKQRYEPPNEIDSAHFVEISTEQEIGESIKQLYSSLLNRNV